MERSAGMVHSGGLTGNRSGLLARSGRDVRSPQPQQLPHRRQIAPADLGVEIADLITSVPFDSPLILPLILTAHERACR